MKMKIINSDSLEYKVLNERIRRFAEQGHDEVIIQNVCGQRFIAAGLNHKVTIKINGVPGNDLGVFMDGPEIVVYGNVQDGTGNTMNSGRIIVYGNAGDITGYSMRGGEIFVKGDIGYRTGIHMKEYKQMYPVIVAGGRAGSYLGEYMAGGLIIILALDGQSPFGDYTGTGMHGGCIYVRGEISDAIIGKEVRVFDVDKKEYEKIMPYLDRFAFYFGEKKEKILEKRFKKIVPVTHRPYGKIYAY